MQREEKGSDEVRCSCAGQVGYTCGGGVVWSVQKFRGVVQASME